MDISTIVAFISGLAVMYFITGMPPLHHIGLGKAAAASNNGNLYITLYRNNASKGLTVGHMNIILDNGAQINVNATTMSKGQFQTTRMFGYAVSGAKPLKVTGITYSCTADCSVIIELDRPRPPLAKITTARLTAKGTSVIASDMTYT